jgi:outer membrane protein OmpA-like peptidoglycan-associated protein
MSFFSLIINKAHRISFSVLLLCMFSICGLAQSDQRRQTIAVTYPLDQTVSVKFRGTTLLPRLSGEAKVRRAGRRGTRVELSVENLPRASELGGVYTTYVLWAISPEGRVDNLGEIKRGGSFLVNSKLDVTTPLQTFALIVTAEPHFLMQRPSRMVVLENLPPQRPGMAEVATINVQYLGNASDYLNDKQPLPEVADSDYRNTPVSLLGARQAVNIARFAGAERDAPEELKEAQTQLETAESAWRLKQSEIDIDAAARRATSLGVRAEETSQARRAARLRREEVARRDASLREAEELAASATKETTDLRAALEREQHARELAERDASSANEQLRAARSELARLRDELQSVRSEGEDAKLKLARIEGEKAAEQTRLASEQKIAQQREAAAALKQTLARYGNVRETSRGMVLTLPESLWASPRASNLSANAQAKIEPLAALLANNPDYQILIQTFTDNRGQETALQQLTQERAQILADQLTRAGLDAARIQANGMGAANPLSPNTSIANRARNRRTEITLVPANAQSNTSSASSVQ